MFLNIFLTILSNFLLLTGKYQFDVLAGQKAADLSRCVSARFVMLNNDSSSLVRFSKFCKEIVVYHSELTVQCCSSGTVATWPVLPKKQATICFEVIFPQTAFVGFDFCSKIHTVDYWFGLIRIVTWFANCDGLINVFWGTAIVFFQHLFTPIGTKLFLGDCQIVRDPTRTNLLCGQVFMRYWKYAAGRNAHWCLYLTVCHLMILHDQFTYSINVIWHNGPCRLATIVYYWIH